MNETNHNYHILLEGNCFAILKERTDQVDVPQMQRNKKLFHEIVESSNPSIFTPIR